MLKVDVENLGSTKKRLQIEVPGEIVTKEIGSAYRKLSKNAKVKGFRPGKVPRAILQRYYGDYVKDEVISKLINDTYFKAISDKDIKPVSQPTIDNGTLEAGKAFEYSAIIEVKPDIQVKDYLSLRLKAGKVEVTGEDVEKRLQELQNLHAQLVTVEERKKVREGDFVIIDYEGLSDGRDSKKRDLENQLIEKLIDGNPFHVPRSMVEQQINYLVTDAKIRLASQGFALKDVGVEEEKLRKDFEETAVKRAKQGLILEKISALEGISVKNEEVTEKLREISLRTNQNVEEVRGYYQKGDRMEELKAGIVEEKTVDFLLKRSNITVN